VEAESDESAEAVVREGRSWILCIGRCAEDCSIGLGGGCGIDGASEAELDAGACGVGPDAACCMAEVAEVSVNGGPGSEDSRNGLGKGC
jgi:hypothetical protein